jgi:DNA-directed RNA polymerase specialized sigma24 family protein
MVYYKRLKKGYEMALRLSIDDITNEHIDFCDNYIKKVITNAKRYSYRQKNKKFRIIVLDLETQSKYLQFEEKGYADIFTTYIPVSKTIIPVYDFDLAKAIFELSRIQRETILRNIVLGDKLTDIAKENGISASMISKHKKRALKIIKQRMLSKE